LNIWSGGHVNDKARSGLVKPAMEAHRIESDRPTRDSLLRNRKLPALTIMRRSSDVDRVIWPWYQLGKGAGREREFGGREF
jgi:hypothetical protein